MSRIETDADVAAALVALTAIDPRLVAVQSIAGPVPLRRREPGFEGLARIVVSQQLSVASAEAIWNRLALACAPLAPEVFTGLDDATLRAAGLSAPKVRTLRGIAAALTEGRVDLAHIAQRDPDDAIAALVTLPGVGRWTAEIFLLFCAGHPDVFPAGDLALANAVADALGLPERPKEPALRAIAESWSPHRGVAARLFWTYYRARREGRETLPV